MTPDPSLIIPWYALELGWLTTTLAHPTGSVTLPSVAGPAPPTTPAHTTGADTKWWGGTAAWLSTDPRPCPADPLAAAPWLIALIHTALAALHPTWAPADREAAARTAAWVISVPDTWTLTAETARALATALRTAGLLGDTAQLLPAAQAVALAAVLDADGRACPSATPAALVMILDGPSTGIGRAQGAQVTATNVRCPGLLPVLTQLRDQTGCGPLPAATLLRHLADPVPGLGPNWADAVAPGLAAYASSVRAARDATAGYDQPLPLMVGGPGARLASLALGPAVTWVPPTTGLMRLARAQTRVL